MVSVNLAQAKATLSDLVKKAESGEEVVITRHGKPVIRFAPIEGPKKGLPWKQLEKLRASQPLSRVSSTVLIRRLRDSRY